MDVRDKVVMVTGGAHGIGRAICQRMAEEGAAGIVVADLDGAAACTVADEVQGVAVTCDVGERAAVEELVDRTLQAYGRVDLVVSNAGITVKGGIDTPDDQWQRMWDVNVMSHVWLTRAVMPHLLEQGSGYLLYTSSAAGLLTEIGSAAYSVTKHGTVAFAEWVSVHHQKQGIGVSCLCPAGVATDFLDLDDPIHQFLHMSSVTPEQVAENVIEALREETFLILPHREVGEFFAYKTTEYDRWLKNFARLNEKLQRTAAKRAASTEDS
ncbi:SDR family oxidoreductase [Maioricimonas sp. JC845]|uniref:SDR family oxidoreductase n=1 Tax=Maioricimonas sp. JC845 TaxID=3232138 RepID=UPI00345817B1